MGTNNSRKTAAVVGLLSRGAADGLMERLGPVGFLAVGLPLMAAAWRLAGPDAPEDDASTLTGRGEEGSL